MAAVSAADFIDALRRFRLLESVQMDELIQVVQPQCADVRALVRAMMERNWLTPFQVNQLLQGNGGDLVLGQYLLLERLNETALGQVYKARHQHMRRRASLTIVREDLLAQPEAVERFYHEIQAVSRLNHSNLVCAFDAGPIGRSHFFALEYVEGIDLAQLVHQSGPLPISLAARLVRQIALALQHAHERGLVHHDFKPAHLLVTRLGGRDDPERPADATPLPNSYSEDAQVKICNLGLTLLLPRPRGTVSTDDSLDGWYHPEGSADFSAPEQQPGTPLHDIRSNIYSLGCVFYYLLTGRVPFPGSDHRHKRAQHQSAEPEPLQSVRWEIPPEISAIVSRLMAKRSEHRFQTPAEVAAALAPLCDEAGRVSKPSPKPAPHLLGQAWVRWAGAGLVLALVLFLISLFSQSAPTTEPEGGKETPGPATTAVAYQRGTTRDETILATLRANRLPTLEGTWYWIGPFDNTDKKGFAAVYPPEKGIDLEAKVPGKGGQTIGWQQFTRVNAHAQPRPGQSATSKVFDHFPLGWIVSLKLYKNNDNTCTYLYHEFEASEPVVLPVSFGSDDTLTVWLNGKKLVSQDVYRACAPDQARADLGVSTGKNQLLLKVCNGNGDYAAYVMPHWPEFLRKKYAGSLERDFPAGR